MNKEETERSIDVTNGNEPSAIQGKKFKTMKLVKDDIKGLYKPPQTLWDESFIGEVIDDDCHPQNSSFAIGAVGGLMTGLVTGFFSQNRVPLPVRTPIPSPLLPKFQALLRNSIIKSSVMWRVTKRAMLGTILFAVLECDFKDFVEKPSDKWKGSIVAGTVCGGIFGLRGGLPGMLLGMTLFSALPAGWEFYNQKDKFKIF